MANVGVARVCFTQRRKGKQRRKERCLFFASLLPFASLRETNSRNLMMSPYGNAVVQLTIDNKKLKIYSSIVFLSIVNRRHSCYSFKYIAEGLNIGIPDCMHNFIH